MPSFRNLHIDKLTDRKQTDGQENQTNKMNTVMLLPPCAVRVNNKQNYLSIENSQLYLSDHNDLKVTVSNINRITLFKPSNPQQRIGPLHGKGLLSSSEALTI